MLTCSPTTTGRAPARRRLPRDVPMTKRSLPACLAAVLLAAPLAAQQPGKEPAVPKAERPKSVLQALNIYPKAIILDGPRDEQRLGVLGDYADGRAWDLSR